MKEKLKTFLFHVSIFYSVVIIAMMLFSFFTAKTTIYLHNYLVLNKEKLNEIKNDVRLLEKNKCTDAINKLIEEYEVTSYDGEVNLRELHNYTYGIEKFDREFTDKFNYYINEAMIQCNLSDDDDLKKKVSFNIVERNILTDELLNKYFYQYEIGLKDAYRLIVEHSSISSEYTFIKHIELDIISDLIEKLSNNEVSDDVQVNEEVLDNE